MCLEGILGKRNTEQDLVNDSADISCWSFLLMLKATTFASCLHGVWRVSGSLSGVCECLANAMVIEVLNQAKIIMAPFVWIFSQELHSRIFGEGQWVVWRCLEVSGGYLWSV